MIGRKDDRKKRWQEEKIDIGWKEDVGRKDDRKDEPNTKFFKPQTRSPLANGNNC